MARNRPRVRLTGGGPTWDERRNKPKQGPPGPSKGEMAAQAALRECLVNLKEALRIRDLGRARMMRRAAWEQVEKLPPHLTWRQRRALGQYKVLLRMAEQEARHRRSR